MSETKTRNLAPKDDPYDATTLQGDTLEAALKAALDELGYVVTTEGVPNYYVDQLERLDNGVYLQIQLRTTDSCTNWLNVSDESVDIIVAWMLDRINRNKTPEREEDNAS